jgi:hypothetical protein
LSRLVRVPTPSKHTFNIYYPYERGILNTNLVLDNNQCIEEREPSFEDYKDGWAMPSILTKGFRKERPIMTLESP